MHYTGIGSRKTPEYMQLLMTVIAIVLDRTDIILRSGGAEGADTAFENGSRNKEIYLPYKNFNDNKSNLIVHEFSNYKEIKEIASTLHPIFKDLPLKYQEYHIRNVCQILGKDLETPSEMVICYTSDGANTKEKVSKKTGGTGTAIKLASITNIPVLNLNNRQDFNEAMEMVGKNSVIEAIVSLSDDIEKRTLNDIVNLFD